MHGYPGWIFRSLHRSYWFIVCDGEGTDDVYVRPEIGFGVSYSFSSLTVDISTNRISGNSDLEGINFTALGITYQIVDKYCGQFLC